MNHVTSRSTGERVHYRKGWRAIKVHDPTGGELARLAAALLLAALALAALALVAFTALPLVAVAGVLLAGRSALRTTAARLLSGGRRRSPTPGPGLSRPADMPPKTLPAPSDGPGAMVYDSRVVVRQ